MDQAEHRAVVCSLIGKFVCSFISAVIFFFLSYRDYIRLDPYSSAFVGFWLFFCAGGKFFPESTKFIGRRARNFRRAKRGLAPLDLGDEPTAEIIPNFERKG